MSISCELCSSSFSCKSNLNKHIKKYHNDITTNKITDSSLSPLELRVIELENIIKSKDEEIQSLKNEIQTLKNPTQEVQNVVLEIKPVLEVEKFNVKKSKIKVKSLTAVQRNDNLLYIHTNENSNTNNVFKMAPQIPPFSNTAINFIQFLDDINIELSHFENVAIKGCITSFMEVIEDQLQMVEPEERPFHYDKPNKILYIKNKDNEWIIDKENSGLFRTFIFKLLKKYMNLIDEYRDKYDNVGNAEHKENSNYSLIIQELNSICDDDSETLKKIMKEVRKCIHWNKTK
jgi:hypothetical protein